MKIRRATEADAEAVRAVAETGSAEKSGERGFLVHVQTAAEYAVRSRVASHFYVAEEDAGIVGFLLAADARSLRLMREGMVGEDDVIDHVLERGGERMVYLDQIAVRTDRQRRRLGNQLFRQLVRDTAGSTLTGAILHEPIRNEASIRFFAREGFRCTGEVREADLIWGIYER